MTSYIFPGIRLFGDSGVGGGYETTKFVMVWKKKKCGRSCSFYSSIGLDIFGSQNPKIMGGSLSLRVI